MRIEPPIPAEVLAAVRRPFEGLEATLADVPLVQPLGMVLDLAGEALRARLFVVQAEGGAEYCLRPDFTAPVARRHIEAGAEQGLYYYQGKAFRAAPAPSTRPEEFLQLGVERFATEDGDPVAADIEMAGLAWAAAESGRLEALLADLPASSAGELLREVWALADIAPVGGRDPADIAARLVRKAEARRAPALSRDQADALQRFLGIEDAPRSALAEIGRLAGGSAPALERALADWNRRLDGLTAAGAPEGQMRFAPRLGQTFDYYDGMTFEVRSQALGADRPVAAGGRYDGLPERLGGRPGRAIGCMVRPWRAYVSGEA